jgi:hypothetical protein
VEIIPREDADGTPIVDNLEKMFCPVCFFPRVRRNSRDLLTCGRASCSYEVRTRGLRGNIYGDCGGGPTATEEISYTAAHYRARKQLKGRPCAQKDSSCSGRIEAALRPDISEDLLRIDEDGQRYYSGLDSTVGYRNLCRSHHAREGQLFSTLLRNPELRDARVIEFFRKYHEETCTLSCEMCDALKQYSSLRAHILNTIHKDTSLALPWYSGKGNHNA